MAVELTAEYLRSIMDYDPESGLFTWKHRADKKPAWNGKFAGEIAGGLMPAGYVQIGIDLKGYYAHRLAWLYVYGESPPQELDHIDRDRANNRVTNLRPATRAENRRNASIRSDNTSEFKGVSFIKPTRRWDARIMHSRRQICLGHFDTPEEAHAAYRKAAEQLHGKFACAG